MTIFSDPKRVFETKVKVPAGAEWMSVTGTAELDINGDGYLDYVVARHSSPTSQTEIRLEIMLGQTNGTFKSGDTTAFSGTLPGVIASQFLSVADFNGDGHLDVFLPEYGIDASPNTGHTNTLLLWDNGKLKEAPNGSLPSDYNAAHSSAAGDIDGDGDTDIFVAAQWGAPALNSHFLINDGTGKFTRDMTILTGDDYYRMWAGAALYDYDNDGDTDVWMGIDSFSGLVLRNDGSGHFEPASRPTSKVDVYTRQIFNLDINKDGLMDVVHVGADGSRSDRSLAIYINKGDLKFIDEAGSRLFGLVAKGEKTFQHLNDVHLGDFNGDGAVDLLVVPNGDDYQVMLNNGDGVFFAPQDSLIPALNGGGHVEVGDYNHDGRDDLLVFDNDSSDAYLLAWKSKPIYPLTGSVKGERLFGDAKGNTIDAKAGNDAIRSGAGKDKLKGGDGKDTLNGGSGKDTLDGGEGKDTLIGGASADRFVFSTMPVALYADKIKDFVHGVDKLAIDDSIFKAIGDSLTSGEFYANAGAVKAHDKSDHIVYNTTTGDLYYDRDGRGGAAAVHFATLMTKPVLDHSDFIIV
jgi:Ca2+-binding RTX toxin-like protein